MRPVRREEIVDYETYSEGREAFRARVLEVKRARRVHLGESLTLLFENTLTIRYQIQEMLRAERIVREADIRHEIETYNEILGGDGALGVTLLIEIDDPEARAVKLREWWALPERLYLELEDGSRAVARFDPRQRGDGRASSVQYLRFDVGGRVPVAVGVDLPGLDWAVRLTAEQHRALGEDLAGVESPQASAA
ncbi:MAG TPA: DUF3501 domain-containing protein [Candidatus Rokubacteria bacterium]|nr:MAG: hypothetical protein A2X53_22350 [Candidatus Rokubacteria bacterium GWA2_70_23]HAM54596.1 DUF3501 domain-containing protein [Candidatus Rokubacteria bacterium]